MIARAHAGRRRVHGLSAARRVDDAGAVTAETAIALPSLLVVAALVVGGVAWAGQVVRCQAAAGDIARAITRHEAPERIEELQRRILPPGTLVERDDDGAVVRIRVRWAPPDDGPLWVRVAPPIVGEAEALVQS